MNQDGSIVIAADAEAVARISADHIATSLAAAVRERGRADWATTGGSAAPSIYRHLVEAPRRDTVPWDAVHVWWGDDRAVPHDDPLSNVKPLHDILLAPGSGVSIPGDHLHPIRIAGGRAAGDTAAGDTAAGDMATQAARALVAELEAADLETRDGWPVLDLVVVGIGGDGHLLSVFPGSPAFDAREWALAIPAPTHIEPHVPRVTMHPAILLAAREVLAVTAGAGKADILAQVLGPVRDPRRWPGQLARRDNATWILDQAAAARLAR